MLLHAHFQIVPNRFNRVNDPAECATLPDEEVVGIERGRVADWDVVEDAWHHLLYTQLGWEEGNEGSLLLCEPILTSRVS